MKKLAYLVILAGMLLLTFLLGSSLILRGDFFFLADQGRDILLVQDILERNPITLIGTHSGLGGFFHGPLWLYQLIPFYLLGKGDPFVFNYAYILLALATVIAGFVVGSSLYNKKIGLIFSFLLALSPSIWSYIPNTIGVNMVPLVFLGMFYFLIRYFRGDTWAYIFAIFFAGLSLQYETALPLIAIAVVFLCFFLNKKILRQPKIILLSIFSFFVSLSTFILFDLRHNFLMSRSLLSLFTHSEHGADYLDFPARIVSHFSSLIGVYETVLVQQTMLLELLFLVGLGLFIFFVIKKHWYKKKESREIWLFLGFPLIVFIFYLAYGYPVWPEYLLGLTVPVALGSSLISVQLWKIKTGKLVLALFVLVSCFEVGKIVHANYFSPFHQDQTSGSYRNQQTVAKWILQDSKEKEVAYFVYTPSTYTYGMDYLMHWEGEKIGKTPLSEKKAITYLVLYPPLQDDAGAHVFWKKHKLKTKGKVIERKKFTGDIIVEKLAISANEPPVDSTYHQALLFR